MIIYTYWLVLVCSQDRVCFRALFWQHRRQPTQLSSLRISLNRKELPNYQKNVYQRVLSFLPSLPPGYPHRRKEEQKAWMLTKKARN